MKQIAPYGEWESPITTSLITGDAVALSLVDLDGDEVLFTELRPRERGRTALVATRLDGSCRRELTPPEVNVRTLVHEYGGAAARAKGGVRLVVSFVDQRVWRLDPDGGAAVPLTPPGDRWADLDVSPDGSWLVGVRERPHDDREHENALCAVPLAGGAPVVLDAGHDFIAAPCFSPDGRTLAYLSWDHPAMPWDGTTLWTLDFAGGRAGAPHAVAGGPAESIFQPGWSPDGVLTFVSDRSGWWNLYRMQCGAPRSLAPASVELGRPLWNLGLTTWCYVDERRIVACATERGVDRLLLIDVARGAVSEELDIGLTAIDGLRVRGTALALVGAAADRPAALLVLDLATRRATTVAQSLAVALDPQNISRPERLEFLGADGEAAHAFFYPPQSSRFTGPSGERPPLLVQCHGGPTSCATAALRLTLQFWTSRGFAVVDVNYGGSSGFGRRYRERLDGRWGEVDLEDCCRAARYLEAQGRVDGRRLAIRGGSAGGYTALCALTFRDVFAAGASHYGITDLRALARDTHKFESRYLERLVGRLPEEAQRYRARSPLHHVDRLATPLIIFQGLEDKVVPPNQAQRLVQELERKGVTHAYVPFADEGHGFRRAASIERALLAELAFYAHVFGFAAPAAAAAAVEIRHPRPRD